MLFLRLLRIFLFQSNGGWSLLSLSPFSPLSPPTSLWPLVPLSPGPLAPNEMEIELGAVVQEA